MGVETVDPILMTAAEMLLAADMIAGDLDGCKLVLFSNDLTITKTITSADLTFVATAGMGSVAITWAAPYTRFDGRVVIAGGSHTFVATAGVFTPFNVFGWAVVDTGGTVLKAAVKLPNPVPVNQPGDGLTITPELLPFDQSA